MRENMPKLPNTEYGLAFYDEGGMHGASGDGYTKEQMYEYAEQYVKESNLVLRITVAYEQGVGHARRTELSNPYAQGTPEYEAWDMGREFGLRKPEKITVTFESERDYLDVKETIEILKNSESERGYSGYYVTLNEDDCIRICRAWSKATKPTLDN